jgi:hypothetical protein
MAHKEDDHIYFDGAASFWLTPDPPRSLEEYIEQHSEYWPLRESFFPSDPTLIIQAIHSGMGGGVIVADNSYKPLKSKWHGATSWQFECSTTGASCTRLCPTAGMKNKVSAYRSKLQEEHASLLGMLSFCNFYNVKGGAIWVGCDNEVAVWQASGQSHKISLGQKTCGHHSGHSVDGLSFQKTWYHSDFLWYRRPSRWHPSLLYTWLTFSA